MRPPSRAMQEEQTCVLSWVHRITMDLTVTHHHTCFSAVMRTAIKVLFFAIRDTTGPTTTVTTTITTAVTTAANTTVSWAGTFFPHLAVSI